MKTEMGIDEFCERLKKIWEENVPDLNFGILMTIVQRKAQSKSRDISFMSNREMILLFEEFDKW